LLLDTRGGGIGVDGADQNPGGSARLLITHKQCEIGTGSSRRKAFQFKRDANGKLTSSEMERGSTRCYVRLQGVSKIKL
jgi:hypothetical protein